ncbi:MAG: type 4a pilus biogenesis protein PilO [Phycisphaerales bacterium JB059]
MSENAESGPSMLTIHAVGAGVAFAALAAGYFLVAAPLLSQTAQRDQLEALINADGNSVQRLQAEAAALRAELDDGRTRIEKSGVELVGQSGRNARMAELTELANACELRLDSLQPGTPTPDDMFLTTPFLMRGAGRYDQVAVFLHELVERFPDVGARSFRLESTAEGSSRLAAFTFDLVWYADPADAAGQPGG